MPNSDPEPWEVFDLEGAWSGKNCICVETTSNLMKEKIKKKFRIRSKKFFLTYPKVVDLPDLKELFLEAMWEAFGIVNKKGMNFIITKELHEDGTPHIHIYLEFQNQMSILSRNRLHVKLIDNGGEEILQEGKYEAVRNAESVIEYVLKDQNEDYITNMNLPIVNGVLYNSPEEHLLAILETEGYEAAADTLLKEYKSLAAKKGTSIMRNLQTLNKILIRQNNDKRVRVMNIEEFEIPEGVLDWKRNWSGKKTLILYGPSGTGKTEFSKSMLKSMGFNTVFIREMNAVKKLDEGVKDPALLFDDVSLFDRTREEKIHILDLENNSQLRILYAIADIPAGTPRVFTTNRLENIIGIEALKEIERRIHLVNIDKSLIISMRRTTVTEEIIVKRS